MRFSLDLIKSCHVWQISLENSCSIVRFRFFRFWRKRSATNSPEQLGQAAVGLGLVGFSGGWIALVSYTNIIIKNSQCKNLQFYIQTKSEQIPINNYHNYHILYLDMITYQFCYFCTILSTNTLLTIIILYFFYYQIFFFLIFFFNEETYQIDKMASQDEFLSRLGVVSTKPQAFVEPMFLLSGCLGGNCFSSCGILGRRRLCLITYKLECGVLV